MNMYIKNRCSKCLDYYTESDRMCSCIICFKVHMGLEEGETTLDVVYYREYGMLQCSRYYNHMLKLHLGSQVRYLHEKDLKCHSDFIDIGSEKVYYEAI